MIERLVLNAPLAAFVVAVLWLSTGAGLAVDATRVALISAAFLPASLIHLALLTPSPVSTLRFVPSAIAVPYSICAITALIGARAHGTLPGAQETVILLIGALLALALVIFAGRCVAGRRRENGLGTFLKLGGLALSIGAALWWFSFAGEKGALLLAADAFPLALLFAMAARRVDFDLFHARQPPGEPMSYEVAVRGIAHAMLKPLGAASSRLRSTQARVDPEVRAEIESATELMEQLQRLVRDLADLARARAAPEKQTIALARVVAQAKEAIEGRFPSASIELDLDAVEVVADELSIRCLFMNLFENALEAGADGVEVTMKAAGGEIHIVVEDHGAGLASDVEGRIFDPFVTTKPRGTGLGLAVVKEVLEAHGGRIRTTPRTSGARFEITLPMNR